MNEEILQKLYSNATAVFDVPPYEQFLIDMQDEAKLIRFRESMAEHFDIPDIETLKKDIGFTTQLEAPVIPEEEEQDLTQQDLTDKLSRGDVDFDEESMVSEEAEYSQRESKGWGSPQSWGDMDVMYDKDATNFEKSLAFINKDLFERDEESVVPKLNYHFNDYGFTFEESGIMDNVTVTASNGKQEEFDIDSWIIASNKKESLKLRNFLRQNQRSSPLNGLESQYQNNRKKYFSRAAADRDIKLIRAESEDLAKKQKEYIQRKAKHEDAMNQFLAASPEMYENVEFQEAYQRQLAEGRYLAQQQTELTSEFKEFKGYSEDINTITGNYMLSKESGGGFFLPLKGMYNKFWEGVGSITTTYLVDGGMDLFMQFVQNTINPEYGFEDNEFKEDFIKYYNKFYAAEYGPVPEGVLEDETQFKEWTETLKGPMKTQYLEKKEGTKGEEFKELAVGAGESVDWFKLPDGTYKGLDDELYDMTKGVKYVMESPGLGLGQPVQVMKVYSKEHDDWVAPPRTLSAKNIYEKVLSIAQDQEIKESKAPVKAITRDFWVDMLGYDEVSDEQIEAQMNQGGAMGILATGWYGAGESIPALLPMIYAALKGKKPKYTGAKGLGKRFTQSLKNFATDGYRQVSLINMAALQNDKLMEQMENDPDFEFVTENEKKIMIAPLAIVTGMLETMGFRHLLKGTPGLVTNIMGEAFKRIPKGASPALFRRTVKNIIDNSLTRGVVKSGVGRFAGRVLPAMAAEFETGGLQEIADISAKDIYNNVKGKEMFDKPEMWSAEFWDQVAFSAMAEAVGGLVMSTPGGIISAASGNDQIIITDKMVELFDKIKNDPLYVNSYLTQLDLEVAQGDISKIEAQKKRTEFEVLRSAATDLDVVEDLDPASKKEALQLIFRRNQLQSKMEGMDKDLGAYQEMDNEVQDIKILLGQVGSKQVAKDAALKQEQENIPIFITEEEAINQLKEEGIENPTPKQIKAKQDAGTKQSTMEEVSQDESKSIEEVVERVPGKVREPSDKGSSQEQNEAAKDEEKEIESPEEIDEFFNKELESNEVISPNISRNKGKPNAKNKPSTNRVRAIVNTAKMAAKALNKYFPKIRVVIHDNVELFKKTTGKGGKARGYYNPDSQTIHINLEKANFTTAPHEAFHALFMETIKTDPAVARVAERMVKSIEKVLPKNSALYKRITAYGKKYEGKEEMNEEKMAELFAILSANPTQFKSLPKNVKSQIIDIIDRFFKKVFGASPFTTPDSRTDAKVFEFMETLSGKIRRGETVTEEDVSVLKEIEKETAPKKKAPSKKKAPAKTEAAQDTPRKGKYQLIADRFTEDQTSNTGKIAEEKVSLDEIKGARLPGGTTRNVYNIGDKVLKIAKNPKGLQQNQSLQYGDLNMLGSVVPNIHEIGLDYIVTENVPRNDKALNEFLKPLRKFTVQDWETKTSKLQDVLYEKGLEDFMNYDLLWNDFVSARNWGQRENGEFVLIDEGALNKNVTSTSEIPVWVKEEWELIKSKRRAERKAPAKTEAAQDTPRKGKEQKSVQEVLVQTNMNAYGFYPANMSAYDQQYVLNLLPQGFDLKKSRVDEYGRGGGWRLFDSNGRRVKKRITRKGKQQLMDKESELVSIVALGREKGAFTDGGIKEYLMRRLKNGKREFSAKEINAALKFNTDLFKSMPKSFGNIEGGFMKGIKLLTNLENYYTKLLKKNKNLKGNKKQTAEQMVHQTIEYMYTLPAYKDSGNPTGTRRTAQQQAMEVEILQYLSPKTTKANSLRVKRLNEAIANKKWNEKNIKGIQRALRQYIRSVLPVSLREYKKSEVIEMIDKINRVNKNNYKNIIAEITDKVTTMTNQSLEESILDILTRKFTAIQSGRLKGIKIDNETYKRLKSIASHILGGKVAKNGRISIQLPKKLTAKQIEDHNQTILNKIEALSTEMVEIGGVKVKVDKTLSEQEQALIADLSLAMNFNNSLALDQNDPIKTNALENIEFSLNQLEEMGRTSMQVQLQKDAWGYMDRALKVLADMGVKLDPLGELEREGKENITQQDIIKKFLELKKDLAIDLSRGKQEKLAVTKRFKLAVKTVAKKIETSLIGSAEDLTGLMDRISLSTGEIFGGATQSIVSDQVRKATRMYKSRMMANTGIVEAKLTQVLGKKWSRKTMKNSNETESVVINQEKNDIIQKEIDRIGKDTKMTSGEKTDLLAQLHKAQNENTMMMSQNQMLYFYAQGQDPSLLGSFETTFKPTKFSGDLAYLNKEMKNDYNSRVKDEIENKLDKGLKKFGTWLIEEYYPNQYEHYNKTYKEVYRTDMPWNKSYAGRLYRQDADNAEGLDLLPGSDNRSWISNVSAASSKARSENTSSIMKTDGIDALLNYTRDMEYFAAYAIPVRNIHKIFSDDAIKKVIEEKFGKDINTFINDAIEKIANQGVKNQTQVKFINFFNNTFLLSRLGLNPTLTLKQLTSAVTYGNDIGYDNWLKMAASTGIKGIRQDIREILDNSVVLQDRYGRPITRAIETYAETKFEKLNGNILSQIGLTKENQNSLTNILMATTMAGDKGAILIGGLPNYRFYKAQALKDGKSEEEAIEIAIVKFENDTLRTQQSYDLQDKDYFQTGNVFSRAFNMFLTTPKQYFRREIIGMRNFVRLARSGGKQGKGTLWQNARSVFVYHAVMPAFFQWVSMGLPGVFRDRREDDLKEIGLSMLLGNLNALFLVGGIAEDLIATVGLDKPWGTKPSSLPLLEQSAKLNELWQRWDKTKDPLKKKEYMYKLMAEAATLTGMPAPQLRRFVDNYGKLLESDDPGEALLRLFNFSEYVQKGPPPKKEKKKKKVRLTQKELRTYYPEIYQEQQRSKEEYEIEYAQEIREAQLLKEEQKRMREEYLREMIE